jgi:hypothetical protein
MFHYPLLPGLYVAGWQPEARKLDNFLKLPETSQPEATPV